MLDRCMPRARQKAKKQTKEPSRLQTNYWIQGQINGKVFIKNISDLIFSVYRTDDPTCIYNYEPMLTRANMDQDLQGSPSRINDVTKTYNTVCQMHIDL